MRRIVVGLLGAVAVAYAAVAWKAPRATDTGITVEALAEELRSTGLQGRELANAAISAVAVAMPYHSAWHLWEEPRTALRHGRGRSPQYNTALLLVLRELGFDTRLVHAARVRGFSRPWFLSGHTWAKVFVDDRWLDACASAPTNAVGEINFVPITDELPVYIRTRWAVGLALSPFVVFTVLSSWITARPIPDWVFGRRELS